MNTFVNLSKIQTEFIWIYICENIFQSRFDQIDTLGHQGAAGLGKVVDPVSQFLIKSSPVISLFLIKKTAFSIIREKTYSNLTKYRSGVPLVFD